MNDFHRANLLTLAQGLMRAVPPPTFDMTDFIAVPNPDYDADVVDGWEDETNPLQLESEFKLELYHECGTTACAVGHGPLFGIAPVPYENWKDYMYRAFGVTMWDDEYEWLFSADWADTDNTPVGAAARIFYHLATGETQVKNYAQMVKSYTEATLVPA